MHPIYEMIPDASEAEVLAFELGYKTAVIDMKQAEIDKLKEALDETRT